MQRHEHTFMGPDAIGQSALPYLANFDFPGEFIDSQHARLAELPLKDNLLIQVPNGDSAEPIPGWLLRADALKLYEMASFSDGDILELGCYHGLSTTIMATAIREGGRATRIETVDLNGACIRAAVANLERNGLSSFVTASESEAAAAVARLAAAGREYGFAFVDHAHDYDPVVAVCRELHRVVKPGGFVQFHDYNDPRNRDPENHDYGVYQAVADGLSTEAFEFYGIYGCSGVYRRVS